MRIEDEMKNLVSDIEEDLIWIMSTIKEIYDYKTGAIHQCFDEILHQEPGKKREKKESCEICNSNGLPENLELHHVAGRKHTHHTITVCEPCHRELSQMQGVWDKSWLNDNLSYRKSFDFLCRGFYDILTLMARKNLELNIGTKLASYFLQIAARKQND